MSVVVESLIESVIVYPQGAEITRVAELAPGATSLKFADLPVGLLNDSVELSLHDVEDEVVAGQFQVGLDATAVENRSELALKIREAELEVRRCQAKMDFEEGVFQELLSFGPASRPTNQLGQEPPPFRVDKQLELLEFRQSELSRSGERLRTVKLKVRAAKERLEKLRIEQKKVAKEIEPGDLRKLVQVELKQPSARESATIKLRYRVDGARWAPAYSARFSHDSAKVEFSMRAIVCQASEEDWDDVELTLSTSFPSDIRECPELKSLKIGRAQPPAGGRTFRPPPPGTEQLFEGFDAAIAPPGFKPLPPPPPSPPPVMRPSAAPMPSKPVMMRSSLADSDDEFLDDAFADVVEEQELESISPFGKSEAGGSAPRRDKDLGRVKMRKRVTPGGRGVFRGPETTELVSDEKLWNFGRLRLPGWNNKRRGELVYQDHFELYKETIHVSREVIVSALNGSAILCHSVRGQSLPSGFSEPRSISGFDHCFRTSGRVQVPSDGQFHSVPVFKENLSSRTEFVVVPRESLDVFRTAELENITCHGLCSGPVDITLGDDFLHTAQLPQVEPSETFDLGLGVCQAVKVTRQTDFRESSSGLMSQSTNLTHDIRFQVVNHLADEITVKIRERLPEVHEPFKDELKVEKSSGGGWESFEQSETPELKSGLQTSVRVASGEAGEVELSYSISMSSKYEIKGGNRREAQG